MRHQLARMKLAKFETSSVEALHATMRRLVLSRVQTHRMDVARISSKWVLQRTRSSAQHDYAREATAKTDKDNNGEEGEEQHGAGQAKRRGGGGGMRAFISETESWGKFTAELSERYRSLPVEGQRPASHCRSSSSRERSVGVRCDAEGVGA